MNIFIGNRFYRCEVYDYDRKSYSTRNNAAVHFLGSRAIPIHFTKAQSKVKKKLENMNSVTFNNEFDYGESTNYKYCFQFRKINFREFSSKQEVRNIIENHNDIFFGIIIEEYENPSDIAKIKLISKFENVPGYEE